MLLQGNYVRSMLAAYDLALFPIHTTSKSAITTQLPLLSREFIFFLARHKIDNSTIILANRTLLL